MKEKRESRNPFSDFVLILILFLVILSTGILGFYTYHKQNWVNALYNASTTMSGVGSSELPTTEGSSIFYSIYSLATGLFYLFIFGFFVNSWINSYNKESM
jgi:ABC-type transport system involved in multi-copper enzyme maturation permease subunit